MNQIKNIWSGKVICEGDENLRKLAEKEGANLKGANLEGANLKEANLEEANLEEANLKWTNLKGANLKGANLEWANLKGANLKGANLEGANLKGANLEWANLEGANLEWANLKGANLEGANLKGATIEFYQFPSIRLISSIQLFNLPDDLEVELMRRDAFAHPYPERFNEWAKNGNCPYRDEERFWLFEPKKELWSPGLPQMADRDLIVAMCKSQGWKIQGHL